MEDPRDRETGAGLQREAAREAGRTGIDLANVKMSMNRSTMIAVEEPCG